MPKKSLNDEQKKVIREKKDSLTAAELAADMYGIGEKTVQKYLDSLSTSDKPEQTPMNQAVKENIQPIIPADKPVTQNGAAIMTPGASIHSDKVNQNINIKYEEAVAPVFKE